jgi:ADP-ribose pyrophosphatase YjhB (NUDIX family)
MKFQEPAHHLQKDILQRLAYAKSLRFSELKPDGLESNIFMYHLKQLISAGAVEKSDGAYLLTSEGLYYADRLSLSQGRMRDQPKIVSWLHVTDAAGNALLWRRAKQPFIDHVDAVQGKLHLGETLQQAATRELAEKTGLSNVPLALRGSVLVAYRQNGVLVSQVFAHIFEGASGQIRPALIASEQGDVFWGDPTKELTLMPVYAYITKSLKSHEQPFLEEIAFDL